MLHAAMGPLIDTYWSEKQKCHSSLRLLDHELTAQNLKLSETLRSAAEVFARLKTLNLSQFDETKTTAFLKQISDKKSNL